MIPLDHILSSAVPDGHMPPLMTHFRTLPALKNLDLNTLGSPAPFAPKTDTSMANATQTDDDESAGKPSSNTQKLLKIKVGEGVIDKEKDRFEVDTVKVRSAKPIICYKRFLNIFYIYVFYDFIYHP